MTDQGLAEKADDILADDPGIREALVVAVVVMVMVVVVVVNPTNINQPTHPPCPRTHPSSSHGRPRSRTIQSQAPTSSHPEFSS